MIGFSDSLEHQQKPQHLRCLFLILAIGPVLIRSWINHTGVASNWRILRGPTGDKK